MAGLTKGVRTGPVYPQTLKRVRAMDLYEVLMRLGGPLDTGRGLAEQRNLRVRYLTHACICLRAVSKKYFPDTNRL